MAAHAALSGEQKPWRRFQGQKTSIANEIRRNLDNYTDAQILPELLQNADDAGAERVAFMLDMRQHATGRLYGSEAHEGSMGELQGPALLAFDSAVFRPEDLDGLFAFGWGSKKHDPTKTGKFGLGFNSVYHITECPQFLTGEFFVALDPQRQYIPGLTPATDPGIQTKPATEDLARLADQFQPFAMPCFGCVPGQAGGFNGTLFRFPLRTPAQAQRTMLRPGAAYTTDKMRFLFEQFRRHGSEMLLFLQAVTTVELWVWEEGATAPLRTDRICLQSDHLHRRPELANWLKHNLKAWSKKTGKEWSSCPEALCQILAGVKPGKVPRYTVALRVLAEHRPAAAQAARASSENWLVRIGVGKRAAWKLAKDPANSHLTFWPAVAVAMRLDQPLDGLAFATLPTNIATKYPVHVNARWCVSDNRKALVVDEDPSHHRYTAWNKALIADGVASLWAELLEAVRTARLPVSQYYRLWPLHEPARTSPWHLVLAPLYDRLANMDVLMVRSPRTRWFPSATEQPPELGALPLQPDEWRGVETGFFPPQNHTLDLLATRRGRSSFLAAVLAAELPQAVKAVSGTGTGTAPTIAPLARFKRAALRLCRWLRHEGDLVSTLARDGCPWVLAAPAGVLAQFSEAGHAVRDSRARLARAFVPDDVRVFYRHAAQSQGLKRTVQGLLPLPGLRASTGSLLAVLQFSLADLDPMTFEACQQLLHLPLLLCADNSVDLFGHQDQPTILAHTGKPRSLLPADQGLFVHPRAARAMGWRELPGEVQAALHLRVFRASALALFMDRVVPGEWAGRELVPWEGRPTPQWLLTFYQLIEEESRARGFDAAATVHAFDAWPVVPARTSINVMLSPTCLPRALRLPDGVTLRDLSPRHRSVVVFLASHDVPLLSNAIQIPKCFAATEFSPRGALRVLAAHSAFNWGPVTSAERELLLQFWEQGGALNDGDLDSLRTLPLFEVEVPAGSPPRFIALHGIETPRELPAGISPGELTGTFLKSKALVCPDLYEQLGVIPLPRDEFYTAHIFPQFESLPDESRLSHMADVRRNWTFLAAMSQSFAATVGKLPFIRMRDGRLASAASVVDPANKLFRTFFPERVVPAAMAAWLPFLRDIGMKTEFDRAAFLVCAQQAAHAQDGIRGPALVNHLIENYRVFLEEEGSPQAFFAEVAGLPLAQPMPCAVPTAYALAEGALLPIQALVAPSRLQGFGGTMHTVYQYDLVWSQAPVLNTHNYLNLELRKLLSMPVPSLDQAMDHLAFLCRLAPQQLAATERFGRRVSVAEALRAVYGFLADAMAESEAASAIQSRLRGLACILLDHKARGAAPQFVAGHQVFLNLLIDDVPPFAFHVSNGHHALCSPSSAALLGALGVCDTPSIAQVISWLHESREEAGARPLQPARLTAVLRMLELLACSRLAPPQRASLVAPDSGGVLHPVDRLVLDDAPWLRPRVRLEALAIAHPRIAVIAKDLGVPSLSAAVEERMEPGFQVEPTRAEIESWNARLNSRQFRNGVRQLMFHEGRSSRMGKLMSAGSSSSSSSSSPRQPHGTDQEQLQRLLQLASLKLVGVRELRSQFVLLSADRDITREPLGSLSLLQRAGDDPFTRLYLKTSVARAKWLPVVAMAINRFLGNSLQNLQVVEKMLECEPAEIPDVLEFLQITSPEGGLGFDDHLGQPIDTVTAGRLRAYAPGANLDLGEEVAFLPGPTHSASTDSAAAGDGEAAATTPQHRFGRLVQVHPDSGLATVEVSPSESRQLQLSQISKILSVREMQAERLKEAELEVTRRQEQTDLPVDGTGLEALDEFEPEEASVVPSSNSDASQARPTVTRTEYRPPDTDWETKELRLLDRLKRENEEVTATLEAEPPGVDELLVIEGFQVPDVADQALKAQAEVSIGTHVKRGYDIVRIGNIKDIAFFHARNETYTAERHALVEQCVDVLCEVSEVFDYNAAFVTLFYQKRALSRFIRQKLLYNIWPIEQYALEHQIADVRTNHFAYMYFYGLHIHKLAHFHDIVHGTRHNFYMNEIRIEFLLEWLELLESKGFDAGQLESSELGTRLLKHVVF